MYRKFGKRLVDILLSGIALIPLSAVYLILAAAIKIDDPGRYFSARSGLVCTRPILKL